MAITLLLGLAAIQSCASFWPTSSISEAKLAELSSGQKVLVAEAWVNGGRLGSTYRFEVVDARTGQQQHRMAHWLFSGSASRSS